MPVISLDAAVFGDVLAREVVVSEVPLFGPGTVLTRQRILILKALGVRMIAVENRNRKDMTVKEAFTNIDKRFGSVADNKLMTAVKSWMKDYLANSGMTHETKND